MLTKDHDKARAFYEGTLGCEFVGLDQIALVVRIGGHQICISKVADFTPLRSTVLGWEVSDIEKRVADSLTERGVAFEKYLFVQDKERSIWTAPGGDQVAWFKDPDGNVLSISEH